MRKLKFLSIIGLLILLGCSAEKERNTITMFLIGDSTMQDYARHADYKEKRYPMTGWGQVFPGFLVPDSLYKLKHLVGADSVVVDNRAIGGRSTRSFFQEGRWRSVYEALLPGDFVVIQFGHNDQSQKGERFVSVEGYKEFLRLFVTQARQKGAMPILLTPVTNNHKWVDGSLQNGHGNYPAAVEEVADDLQVALIDLNQLSIDAFSKVGREHLGSRYFMNLEPGAYVAYPEGLDDNTHFNADGAQIVAQLVFEALQTLSREAGMTATSVDTEAVEIKERFDSKEEILSRIVPPTFSDREFLISEFGGAGDGTTDNKPAFDKAMQASGEAGGGRVIVPAGNYLVNGPIHFVSNTELHLEDGARLFFSSDPAHYLPVVATSWEGTLLYNYSPFIYAFQCENIAITGKGTIDGEASETWQLWRDIQQESQLLSREMNNNSVPVEARIFGEGHYLRPHLIQFYDCKNILVEDVLIEDAPFWCVHLLMSRNVTVRGVRFDAHNKNNDGIDPEYSQDVLIENVTFNNGDDNVAIKAGRDLEGRTLGMSTKNIIVRNCKLKGLHGIVIGSEMAAGVHNVFVEDCEASGYLKRGLYIKSNPDRGGEISNIYFKNVKLDQVEDAFFITSFYHKEGEGHVTHIHDIFVEDVYCREATASGIVVHGFPELKVHDIHFSNVTIEKAEVAFDLKDARNIILEDVSIGGEAGPPSWAQ